VGVGMGVPVWPNSSLTEIFARLSNNL
jgi:hypothetical protein